jgi:hypothetical protein
VHRFPRVAAIVLLEYLAATAVIFGALEGMAAVETSSRQCGVDKCAILGLFWVEALLLLAGLVVAGFIISLIVIAFRQRRWARTRNPASYETSLFASATVATAWGWAWALPAWPLILWTANQVFDLIQS